MYVMRTIVELIIKSSYQQNAKRLGKGERGELQRSREK
jgi:hypothetical protein